MRVINISDTVQVVTVYPSTEPMLRTFGAPYLLLKPPNLRMRREIAPGC